METYKLHIADLKSRNQVYVPVKDDLIDKILADYLNSQIDRTKL